MKNIFKSFQLAQLKSLTGIFVFIVSIAKAQTGVFIPVYSRADNLVNNFMKTWNINGGSVAITKNGQLIYNRAFGFADQKKNRSARPGDLYRIASVSKPITSIAIMKLAEEGMLLLSDTVFGKNRILDDPYYTGVIRDNRIYSITIRQLLEHTAGWERSAGYEQYSFCDPPFFPLHVTALAGEPNPVGDSTLIQFLLRKGLDYKPGTTFAYSNVGYLVLGKVIEKLSGLKYEEYVDKKIFQPLGICDIRPGRNLLADRHEREVEYVSAGTTTSCYGDGRKVPAQYGGFNLEAMNAHGGWIATASDLTKLILAVDGFDTSPDILSAKSIALMTKPGAINSYYAKGWSVNRQNNWWHTGSLDGSASFVCRSSDGYTFAFLFNSRSDNSRAFWEAFDRLPWDCRNSLESAPEMDLTAPSSNVSGLRAESVAAGAVKVSWSNGSGKGRLIIVSENPLLQSFPVDGNIYIADPAFGYSKGTGNGGYVVYNGEGSDVTIKNLAPGKTYFITAFEYNRNRNTGYLPVYKQGCSERLTVTADDNYTALTADSGILMIGQNEPNPFYNETGISYVLPENSKSAYLSIYDLHGKKIRETPVSNRGTAIIQAGDLPAGIYSYVFVADGRMLGSKRMVVMKR